MVVAYKLNAVLFIDIISSNAYLTGNNSSD